ncbi:MAG: hypothetical protein ISS93_00065 [Candidatus Aenigmarchaeota archaeon]|nr:hypothetical protein [Candidatus Aenigmarchaeota archaeon]
MVCWAVPLIATVVGFVARKASRRGGVHGFWLNIMLLGGALFGAIDHLWYGELFIITANWGMDLALGGAITAGITAGWGAIVFKPQISGSLKQLSYCLGIFRK